MLLGEKVPQPDSIQNVLHFRSGIHDLERAIRRRCKVVQVNDLANTGGINVGDVRQIEHDGPYTVIEQAPDLVAQLAIHRNAQRSFDTDDMDVTSGLQECDHAAFLLVVVALE
jgi:hypothetical protein